MNDASNTPAAAKTAAIADSTGEAALSAAVLPRLSADLSSERRRWKVEFRGPLRCRRAGEPEALLLTLLCALDMYTTLWWVVMGQAVEANKLLAWTFHYHPLTFVVVKCMSCLPALFLAPRIAQRRPQFITWLLRIIIVVYIAVYVLGVR